MSMHNFAEYGFGVVLTGTSIEEFLRLNTDEKDPIEYCWSDEAENKEHDIRYYGDDFDGRVFVALDEHSEKYFLEDMLVIWAKYQPDAFKQAYVDLDGLIREMQQEFRFPENFDWKAHAGYFSCVAYC